LLAAQYRDITTAEDILSDAFERALSTWDKTGIPDNPEAWLLTVAKNKYKDRVRSASYRLDRQLEDAEELPDVQNDSNREIDDIPDKRLALMFVCAHPAIDSQIHTALMLQTVLGLEVKHIASAFMIPPTALAQRLVRAKKRIKEAGVPFAIPGKEVIAKRLEAVLEAVYGAYAIDYPHAATQELQGSLSGEALFLAATLAELMPEEPEALGLAALVCLSVARHDARIDENETYIPLDEQNPQQWDKELIMRGERYLHRACAVHSIGRFQLEAAIQSAHCARLYSGQTDWEAIVRLYEALVNCAPTIGAQISLVAARWRTEGPHAALAEISGIDNPRLSSFQPFWATKAQLLEAAGDLPSARFAYEKAISLTTDISSRRYLERKKAALM
jgi:RNA polymerase sigma-70 factor (ECF subfamily)